jgi:hypothetical protein
VSEQAMFSRRNQRFSDNVEEIRSDDKIEGNAQRKERWSCQKASADTKEAAENADNESEED